MDRKNERVVRDEKAKVKKQMLKEMKLLRLREPNMRKKEYH